MMTNEFLKNSVAVGSRQIGSHRVNESSRVFYHPTVSDGLSVLLSLLGAVGTMNKSCGTQIKIPALVDPINRLSEIIVNQKINHVGLLD